MSELNWCEIGPEKTHRNEVLSEYLKSQGIQNQFTFIKTEISEIKSKIEEAQSLKQFIRFHNKFLECISANISNNRRETDTLKAIDSLMYHNDRGYWPEVFLKDAISEYLTLKVKNLDVSQRAFIVGSCGVARAAISALVKLGFSNINITAESDEEALALTKDFKEMYFNVQFDCTKRKDVTILPGAHGIVINTLSILDSNNFPTEIYYFNFLKKGGLAVDLVDVPPETPFTKIAKDIGAQFLSGFELMGYFDLKWVEKATGQKLELAPYLTLLKTKLEQVSYDKTKVEKILADFQI
jgi:hypothetical protein